MKSLLIYLMILGLIGAGQHPMANKSSYGTSPPDDICQEFKKIYDDALTNFSHHRGEKKTMTGLFGETTYWEYNITLWDSERAELYPSLFTTANSVDFRYCMTGSLEEANQCHANLVKKVRSCFPVEYYLDYGEPDEEGKAFVRISDKRDGNPEEDLIFTYGFPLINIKVVKEGTDYFVELNFIAGEEF